MSLPANAPRTTAIASIGLLAAVLAVTSCAAPAAGPGDPPMAAARPHELETHGEVRVDEYYWLREREDPEVIAYLEAENEYLGGVMAHTEELQETLFEEIRGRIVEDDSSVPYRDGDYWYYTRYEEGKQYPIYCRRPADGDAFGGAADPAAEEVLVDVNEIAEGKEYTSVRPSVSPDHRILAYAVDDVGRRFYTVRFKDLSTGETLPDEIPDVTANLAWAADSATLFYVRQDPDTLRSYQVFRHRLGRGSADDLVYEEPDETFSVFLRRSQSRKYVMAVSSHTLRTEVRTLRADDPDGDFAVFEPRGERHEYSVDHLGDRFWVRTNDGAPNFRLMSTAEDDTGRAAWREERPHRDDVLLEGFELFDRFLVLSERRGGLNQIRIEADGRRRYGGSRPGLRRAGLLRGARRQPRSSSSRTLRYVYQSLTTPRSVFDYDPATREKTLRKQDQVLGGLRLGGLPDRAALGGRLGRHGGAGVRRLPARSASGRGRQPVAPLRLRLLRRQHGRGIQFAAAEPARPRLRLRHRPHPGRRGDGALLVRRRQAPEQEEHLHRLRRRRRASGGRGLRRSRPDLCYGRQRRRAS